MPIFRPNSSKTIPFGAAHTYVAHIKEYPSVLRTSQKALIIHFDFKNSYDSYELPNSHQNANLNSENASATPRHHYS